MLIFHPEIANMEHMYNGLYVNSEKFDVKYEKIYKANEIKTILKSFEKYTALRHLYLYSYLLLLGVSCTLNVLGKNLQLD